MRKNTFTRPGSASTRWGSLKRCRRPLAGFNEVMEVMRRWERKGKREKIEGKKKQEIRVVFPLAQSAGQATA